MQSSFFAHFMCFEVPALVPPGGANGGKPGYDDDDDDLGIMDIDENDSKSGTPTNCYLYYSFHAEKREFLVVCGHI